MTVQEDKLSEENLSKDLWDWESRVHDLTWSLREERDDPRELNQEGLEVEHQRALEQTKEIEKQLKPYQNELNKILEILSQDKKNSMQRYCELKRQQIRKGTTGALDQDLSKLRLGFSPAAKRAQPKVNKLLEVIDWCETAVSLYKKHSDWVKTVAWDQGISLPQEDQAESQVGSDLQSNTRGAGRKPDKNVDRRRKKMFEKLDTADLKEAKRRWYRPECRHGIYQYLDEQDVKMISSERFKHYKGWTELSEEPLDDWSARDTLFRDLERNWVKLVSKARHN